MDAVRQLVEKWRGEARDLVLRSVELGKMLNADPNHAMDGYAIARRRGLMEDANRLLLEAVLIFDLAGRLEFALGAERAAGPFGEFGRLRDGIFDGQLPGDPPILIK